MIWYFAPRIIAAAMTIVILMTLTRVLSAADFGRYNLVVLSGTTAFSFLFAWLVTCVHRFHSDSSLDGNTIPYVLGAGLRISAAILSIVVGGYFFLPQETATLVLFGMLYCVSHALHEAGLSFLRVYEERKTYAVLALVRPILGVSLAVTFVMNGGSFTSAVLGMSLGAMVSGGYAVLLAASRAGIRMPTRSVTRSFLSFGYPLALVTSVSSLYMLISQSMLAMFISLEVVGFFAAANMLSMRTLRMPMGQLMNAVAAKIFREYEVNGKAASDAALSRYFSVLVLIAMPILVLLVFGGHAIASLIFEAEFATEVVPFLRIIAIAAFIMGMQGAYFSFAYMRSKKTTLQLTIMIGSVALHAVLSFLFIKFFGVQGAPYAFLTNGTLTLIVFVALGRSVADPIVIPYGEMGRTLPGMAVFALFVSAMDFVASPYLQVAVVLSGLVAMFLTLLAFNQTAAYITVKRLRRTYASKARGLADSRPSEILKRMKKSKDEFNGVTLYRHPNVPRFADTRSHLAVYAVQNDSAVWLRMRLHYTNDRWLFVENAVLNLDGEIVRLPYKEWRRDYNLKVWEWIDVAVDPGLRKTLEKIVASKKAIARFEGEQYYDDVTLGEADKLAIRDMLSVEDFLRNSQTNSNLFKEQK